MLPKTRTFQIWKTVAMAVVDFLFLNLGIGLVYLYRFRYYSWLFDSSSRLTPIEYFYFNIIFSVLVIFTFSFLGIYEINRKKSLAIQTTRSLFGIFLIIFAFVSFFFFFEFDKNIFPDSIPISRFILMFAGFSAFFSVLCGRIIFWLSERIFWMYDISTLTVVVIGDKNDEITNYLKSQPSVSNIISYTKLNLHHLKKLQSKMLKGEISEIFVGENHGGHLEGKLAWLAERYKVNFVFAPEGFGKFQFFDLRPKRINQKLFLEVMHSNLDGWRIVFKRIFDIFFASLFLITFSPVYIIIAFLIWLEDKKSPFYLSDRVGPDGKIFKLWKFRRLKWEYCTSKTNKVALEFEKKLILEKDTRNDGVLYKIQNDPRSTKIGQFIEKTSLDEIPQFINVLMGNMSVVGPRPHQPREVAKYQNEHYKVLNIKPGITGMAQINGRSDLKFEKEVELDCWYIENWSFWLDILIVAKTPLILTKRHKS